MYTRGQARARREALVQTRSRARSGGTRATYPSKRDAPLERPEDGISSKKRSRPRKPHIYVPTNRNECPLLTRDGWMAVIRYFTSAEWWNQVPRIKPRYIRFLPRWYKDSNEGYSALAYLSLRATHPCLTRLLPIDLVLCKLIDITKCTEEFSVPPNIEDKDSLLNRWLNRAHRDKYYVEPKRRNALVDYIIHCKFPRELELHHLLQCIPQTHAAMVWEGHSIPRKIMRVAISGDPPHVELARRLLAAHDAIEGPRPCHCKTTCACTFSWGMWAASNLRYRNMDLERQEIVRLAIASDFKQPAMTRVDAGNYAHSKGFTDVFALAPEPLFDPAVTGKIAYMARIMNTYCIDSGDAVI